MTRTITGYAIGYLKYLVVFIAALAIPSLFANQVGGTAALGMMLVTLFIAAQYGKQQLA